MSVDERLRRGLHQIPPADPSGAYERIVEKRVRRRVARRAARVALVLVVVAGSAAGFLGLATAFRHGSQPLGTITGGRIAFTNFDPSRAIDQVSAGWGIYTMNPDGTDVTSVRANVDEALFPSFSPDGERIAFAGFRDDPQERGLFVTDMNGTTQEILRIQDRRHQIDDVAWSPDATKIGFVYTEFTPTEPPPTFGARDMTASNTIWTIAPDGSDLTRITTPGRERDLSWSPDGSRIVFSRYERVSENEIQSDLYIVDADGSHEVRLTTDADASSPAWSPDGRTIVYEGSGGASVDLYSIGIDGTGARRLTDDPGNEYQPAWSPDATAIAYAERALDPGSNASACYVSVMLPDGTGRERIAGSRDAEGCPGQEGISWAPANISPTTATASPTGESPTSSPSPGQDIGLGYTLCDVHVLKGMDFLGDGTNGTAWTGAPLEAGRCPLERPDTYVVAADWTGDGVADDAWHAIEDCFMCQPYAAIDLDANGDDELAVLTGAGTTPRYDFFDVGGTDRGTRVRPVIIEPQGDEPAGFGAGEIAGWTPGGDEGYDGNVACEGFPDHPVLVAGWSWAPVDGPGSETEEVHIIRFVVEDGRARIVSAEDTMQPSGNQLPYPFGSDYRACGVDWNPF